MTAIVTMSALRPFLNDALSVALFDVSTGGNWGGRILSNLVASSALLIICAIAVSAHRQLTDTTERLRDAAARMRDAVDHAHHLHDTTPQLLRDASDELRTARNALLDGTVDFDRVRDYAEIVRATSHRLDERARAAVTAVGTPTRRTEHVPLLTRLVPTPPFVVIGLYLATSLPFGIAHGGPGVIVPVIAAAIVIETITGAVTRAAARRSAAHFGWRTPIFFPLVFLATWLVAAVAVMALTFLLVPDVGALGFVPIGGVPLIAVVVSLGLGTFHRARAEARRATVVLADTARRLAAVLDAARTPLERGVELLHGRLQGRCVILAARVDDESATPALLAGFRAETDGILDALIHATGTPETAGESIDDLRDAWSIVIATELHCDDRARLALDASSIRDRAVQIVNEALVNALKHSAARTARIELVGRADALRVRVAASGTLTATTRGLGSRTDGTTITQHSGDVVLEGRIPLVHATRGIPSSARYTPVAD